MPSASPTFATRLPTLPGHYTRVSPRSSIPNLPPNTSMAVAKYSATELALLPGALAKPIPRLLRYVASTWSMPIVAVPQTAHECPPAAQHPPAFPTALRRHPHRAARSVISRRQCLTRTPQQAPQPETGSSRPPRQQSFAAIPFRVEHAFFVDATVCVSTEEILCACNRFAGSTALL